MSNLTVLQYLICLLHPFHIDSLYRKVSILRQIWLLVLQCFLFLFIFFVRRIEIQSHSWKWNVYIAMSSTKIEFRLGFESIEDEERRKKNSLNIANGIDILGRNYFYYLLFEKHWKSIILFSLISQNDKNVESIFNGNSGFRTLKSRSC